MTKFENIKPLDGSVANTYEYTVDVALIPADGTEIAESAWVNLPEITAFQPNRTPKTADAGTYANKGTADQTKIGEDFSGTFNILKRRTDGVEFAESWQILKTASDAIGADNVLAVRYYDSLGANDAYQGRASVVRNQRPNTGNDGVEFDAFTFTGKDRFVPIVNPEKPGA